MARVVFFAIPIGYGPAAKAIAIADALAEHDVNSSFIGTGVAYELASRARCFAQVLDLPPEAARTVLRSAGAAISLMDRTYSEVALAENLPLYVVDSLAWMRDEIPAVFTHARRYFVQNFVGVAQKAAAWPVAQIVGPVIPRWNRPPRFQREGLVIQLGGLDGLLLAQEADARVWIQMVARGLAQSGLLRHFAGRTRILVGDRGARQLRELALLSELEPESVTHEESVAALRAAEFIVTAPGLTGTLEAFQSGAPTFFLPPQNYSQWWIVKKLREQNLAPLSFHWADLLSPDPIVEKMPEAARAPLIRQIILQLSQQESAQRQLTSGLAAIASFAREDLACRQRAFFDSLGENGVEQIAAEVSKRLTPHRGSHEHIAAG